MLCTAIAVLLTANMVWAQEGAQVDKDALKARRGEINKEMGKIRDKLRKESKEIQALYAQQMELRKKIDEALGAASPEYAKLAQERQDIHKKLYPRKPKKAGAKKGGKKKAAKKE